MNALRGECKMRQRQGSIYNETCVSTLDTLTLAESCRVMQPAKRHSIDMQLEAFDGLSTLAVLILLQSFNTQLHNATQL